MRSRCSSVRDERTVSFLLIGIGGSLARYACFTRILRPTWVRVGVSEGARERECKSYVWVEPGCFLNKSKNLAQRINSLDQIYHDEAPNILALNKSSAINHLAGVVCPFGSSFCPPYLPTSACRPTLFTYGVQKISLDDGKVWYCTALLSHTSVYVHVIL